MTYQELERAADEAAGDLREAARRWHEKNTPLKKNAVLRAAWAYGEAWEAQQAAFRDGLRDTLQPWVKS